MLRGRTPGALRGLGARVELHPRDRGLSGPDEQAKPFRLPAATDRGVETKRTARRFPCVRRQMVASQPRAQASRFELLLPMPRLT
jgi:hypothetical protein